ncbi:MAG: hypothetical protein AMJ68_07030 [Acidithiobacillales bacterium SG8_45]|nr:MAG: hypothetical protein AMJ68_07030 [Acidithiobacillales bacterium SG8_45]
MKRRPELTAAEFREYWNSPEFADLVNRSADVFGAKKVTRNLTYQIELTTILMTERGGIEEPYDAIMEMWWESPAELETLRNTGEAEQALKEMAAFQQKFVDFSRSQRFLTEWTSDA